MQEKAADATKRPESNIGTRPRWASREIVSSQDIKCAHTGKETRAQSSLHCALCGVNKRSSNEHPE